MNNSVFIFDYPANETVRTYTPGTDERKELVSELNSMASQEMEIPLIIGGKEVRTGNLEPVRMPHDHQHILGRYHKAGEKEIKMAVDAALKAHKEWESFSWFERASITVKAAELISKKFRNRLNAATMLGQSKSAFQAEIDAACETTDFLRFNAHYISDIYHDQPHSDPGIINRLEYRPLEGFVFTVSPFNFTAIASNLNMAPILMGNVTVWKPATTAILSNYVLMEVFQEAGMPDGVLNFIPGSGAQIGEILFNHKEFAGLHFTGSNNTFNKLWLKAAGNLPNYRSYPRIVGETGGKDFVLVHETARSQEVATALIRGAFEYQGQKCSAASRAYIPESLWPSVKEIMGDMISQIKIGDVRDFGNFMNAVIDEASFDNISNYIKMADSSPNAEIVFGGKCDKSTGYFVEPTVIKVSDPHFATMEEEIFGPVLSIYVYKDSKFEETLQLVDETSPYALTGSIFAQDRYVLTAAADRLKYSAGNLYFNDKPTGAVVGQQPFGGSRQSGTNDKSGSHLNLLRWTNPRTIKETLIPPTDFKYPFMQGE
ncbi:MAG: L-glutamate gamma-semialdehyde dehydrogenase [Bacteroidales bacterium]|nr:L-glutamate gamma-semialdehyde dehydrogenase [Bacteroidales bacterium]